MKYKGWIPVASGFLSYTNIRGQIIPGRCSEPPTIEGSPDDGRFQISSTRSLIDKPSALASADDQYDFVCRAERADQNGEERLAGIIFAYPRVERRTAETVLKDQNIRPGVHRVCLGWAIAFTLCRNGFVTLDWGDTTREQIEWIFDTDDIPADQAERLLTFESFSFLKDLAHNHKFHSIDDDSIVVPIPVTSDSDESWKDWTARSIHRAVVSSFRNHPARIELANAIGKICYLRTFLKLANTPFCQQMLESLDNLNRAIDARMQRESVHSGGWEVFKSVWLSIFLAAIATLVTLVQLLQIPCIETLGGATGCKTVFHVQPSTIRVADFLLSNLTSAAVVLFVVLASIGYLATRRSMLDLLSQRMGGETFDWYLLRFVYGLALTKGKYMAFFWLTLFAAFILSLLGVAIVSVLR